MTKLNDDKLDKTKKRSVSSDEVIKDDGKGAVKGTRRRGSRRGRPGEGDDEAGAGGHKKPDEPEFIEQVIAINRVTKVTKGGKKLAFSALVVVGDGKGRVGFALEKAAEVAIAIRKSMGVAKRNLMVVALRGTTIPHEIIGRCGASRVLLKPAGDGTGVIAAGPVRAVCDGAGIRNILSKCHRSNNPINVVKATLDGLKRLKSVKTTPIPETQQRES
ncbi:MAG: 30S ribosomal protein S5 [Candidatus Omnitrophica bacterium]|nr:30S ribosomal protein S5 [Candidatus Omnitrophota bacterium]